MNLGPRLLRSLVCLVSLAFLFSCSEPAENDPDPYQEAKNLIRSGDAEAGVALLLENLETYDEFPEYWALVSHGFRSLDSPDLVKALGAIRQALELESENGYYQYCESFVLEEMGLLEEALVPANRAIELEPSEPFYHFQMGTIYEKMMNLEFARDCFLRSRELDGSVLIVWTALARVQEKLRELEDARGTLERAAEEWKDDPEIRRKLADFLIRNEDYEAAIPELMTLIRSGSDESEDAGRELFDLANEHLSLLDALQVFTEAVDQNPTNPAMMRYLGDTYQRGEHWEEAEVCYRKAIDLPDSDPEIWDFLIMTQVRRGEIQEVRKTLEQGLRLEPENEYLWKSKAVVEFVRGKPEKSIAALERFAEVAENPREDGIWARLIKQFEKTGTPERAAEVREIANRIGVTEEWLTP